MAAVLAEGTSIGAWRSVRCFGARRYVRVATLITFVALAFGEEAAAGYVCVVATVTLGAAVLLGKLEAELLAAAADRSRRAAGVATGDSKAA